MGNIVTTRYIMDLYPFGYKTIPSVNNYTRSGIVPHFSTMICLHEVGYNVHLVGDNITYRFPR